ncbi:MAG: hypothetical protein ACHREM_00085 [Polyangiales bacterium]
MSGSTPVKLYRYALPSVRGEGWGIFVVGSDGFFACITDWGDYSYLWSHHGCPDFRLFLLGMTKDPHYFITKFAPEREYDNDKTVENIRKEILRARAEAARRGHRGDPPLETLKGGWPKWSEEHARDEWELVKHLASQDLDFRAWYEETAMAEPHDLMKMVQDRQCVTMFEKLIPRFVGLVRAELVAEGLCKAEGNAA